jgi:hypothetical protein
MTATDHAGAPEGVAQDIEAPVAEQAAVGPLTFSLGRPVMT